MRTRTPSLVGVSVQVMTVLRPSPPLRPTFQLYRRAAGWALREDLTVDDAVPMRHWPGAEIKLVPDNRLEVVLHQPFLDQRSLGEGAPNLFRRMRHLQLDDDGTRGDGGGSGHWSILFSKASRRSSRPRQRAQ